ncbi:hypothetical protein NDU88_002009 [Pleurodeles waltl]|uniref:Uncharacterized protein n=1 Tax=Pleurodeles waltl TaxID=8319 RepID=A0AAV7RD93_PLEWA|nr:hypothetical protein NDU88_002009 [Pleurodeles waltl]
MLKCGAPTVGAWAKEIGPGGPEPTASPLLPPQGLGAVERGGKKIPPACGLDTNHIATAWIGRSPGPGKQIGTSSRDARGAVVTNAHPLTS